MIAFAVGQAEQTLFDDGIFPVPKSQGEAQALAVVRDTGQTVFAPPISPRPRLIVTEIVPGIPVVAVVLAHSTPLAFAEVRSPLFPWNCLFPRFIESLLFGSHNH